MKMFRSIALILALLLPSAILAQGKKAIRDRDVESAIKSLTKLLLDSQKANGSWEYHQYTVGCTALCLLALKQAELPNDHPAVRKATKYIVGSFDRKVYSEALVASALEKVDPKRYKTRIRQAAGYLENSQAKSGGWSYTSPATRHDNSNTQFAVLGLAAAERAGIVIDARVKKRAKNHWLKTQGKDGAWGYSSTARGFKPKAMTLAGLASLNLLGEELERKPKACAGYENNGFMKKSLDWLVALMKQEKTPGEIFGTGRTYYSLYALERVAIFLGIKEFGDVDWYRWGAIWIVGQLKGDRVTIKVADAAFALLFLAKGKAPIAIAKWRWEGDWNNQHQDAQRWCEYAGEDLKQKLDWLPAQLDGLDSSAAKASMIFVNGRTEFKMGKEEEEFIRSFLDEGGTLVTEITCDDKIFVESFQKVMRKKLYPDLSPKFVPITKDHPVAWIKNKLSLKDVAGLEMRAGCKRLNVLILMRNVSCAVNGDLDVQRDLERSRKVTTNVMAWALQNRSAGKKLDDAALKETPDRVVMTPDQIKRKKAQKSKQFRQAMGRLKHGGNWYASPRYFATLTKVLDLRKDFPKFDGEVYVSPTRNDLFQSAVLFVTGYGDPVMKDTAVVSLRTYVQNGGTIFAVNACTSKEFDAGFRKLLKKTFPNDKLETIPQTDALYQKPVDLRKRKGTGTKAYIKEYKETWAPLHGIRRDGRWVVVYSAVDMCSDMSEGLHDSVIGYKKESGAVLSVNILYHLLLP